MQPARTTSVPSMIEDPIFLNPNPSRRSSVVLLRGGLPVAACTAMDGADTGKMAKRLARLTWKTARPGRTRSKNHAPLRRHQNVIALLSLMNLTAKWQRRSSPCILTSADDRSPGFSMTQASSWISFVACRGPGIILAKALPYPGHMGPDLTWQTGVPDEAPHRSC